MRPIFITDFYRSQNPVVTQADSAATFSRAGSAYRQYPYGSDSYISEVTSDTLRCSWRQGKNGLWIRGAFLESSRTNRVLRNTEIENSVWSKDNCNIVNTTDILPNGEISNYDVIHENTATGYHKITNLLTSFPAGPVTFSAFLKAINRGIVQLGASSDYSYFDLINGEVYSQSGGVINTDMYYYGRGWWLCQYSINISAGGQWCHIVMVNSDGQNIFLGEDQDSAFVWGIQFEEGAYTSSYIFTEDSPVMRAADSDWQAAIALNDSGEGWCSTAIWIPAHTPIAEIPVMTISNSGSATNYIKLVINTSRQLELRSAADGGDSGLCLGGIVADGGVYQIYFTWKNNNLSLCLNGIWATTDSSVTIPDLNQINLHPFGGIIGDIQIGDVYSRIPWRIPAAL